MEEVVARLLDDAVGVSKSAAAALGERGGNDSAMEMAAWWLAGDGGCDMLTTKFGKHKVIIGLESVSASKS
uniref:Uncharacterized protein n=1 Tax=Oryza sativa subsp. japonica TaxID=39947 RepID=Q5VN79_ORYSJ|nr:hypothetical protein [Oryza sativa Japonica Group]